jgi:transposase
MEARRKYRKYDEQFKRDAVALVLEGGRSIAEVSRDLGIGSSIIQRWVTAVRANPAAAFPGKGKLSPEAQELETLRRKLAVAEEERDILKKALAVFSVRRP